MSSGAFCTSIFKGLWGKAPKTLSHLPPSSISSLWGIKSTEEFNVCHIGRRALRACEMSAVLKSGFSPLELLKAPRETQVETCDLAGGGQKFACGFVQPSCNICNHLFWWVSCGCISSNVCTDWETAEIKWWKHCQPSRLILNRRSVKVTSHFTLTSVSDGHLWGQTRSL